MPDLKTLLADMSRAIVDYPDDIVIDETLEGDTIVFTITVAESDMGKIIGRHGKNARSIRTVMKAAANLVGKKVIVEVGLLRDVATLALDCSGAGLSRRSYRTYNVAAPLSETLGAAMVLLSRHKPEQPLIDPMCGSGTMPIEAAMIAQNIAPGANRSFAAENWSFMAPSYWEAAREEAKDSIRDVKLDILGSDIDAHCIDLCKKHAKKAGIMVNWAVKPLKELATDKFGGVILCNPPYGERLMKKNEVESLYREMRRVFDALPDWNKNIITGFREFERTYGKRADKRRKLSNGGMPCTLYQYFK